MASYCIARLIIYATGTEHAPVSPPLIADYGTCRYRLDDLTSATFTLPDGRQLGYAEYGSPSGKPIFYAHGLPGSRLEAAASDEAAAKVGARLIAVDRPGIGWSSPHPECSILDHARDVELLAAHLDLDGFGVLGVSGGGPYALACAAAISAPKLTSVAVVCGLGAPDMGYAGMSWHNYFGFAVGFRYLPWVCRLWMGRQYVARLDLPVEERLEGLRREVSQPGVHEKDLAIFRGEDDLLRLTLRSNQEVFAHGLDAWLLDGRRLSRDFGFRVEEIRADLPVQLWYGGLDTNVPVTHGEQTAARLKGKVELHIEDETHTSIVVCWREKVFEDLVANM